MNEASVHHEAPTMRLEERHHRVRRVHFSLREPLQPTNPRARMNIDPSVLSRWAGEPLHLPAARVCRKSSLRPGKSCANATSRATKWHVPLHQAGAHLCPPLDGSGAEAEAAERWSSAALSTCSTRPCCSCSTATQPVRLGTCLVHMVRAVPDAVCMSVVKCRSAERAWNQCVHGTV